MTPYAQMLAAGMRPEAQATFGYEYNRYSKDSTLALVLTIVLGIVGGESYYLGNYGRAILMTIALFTGVGLLLHDSERVRRVQRLRRVHVGRAVLVGRIQRRRGSAAAGCSRTDPRSPQCRRRPDDDARSLMRIRSTLEEAGREAQQLASDVQQTLDSALDRLARSFRDKIDVNALVARAIDRLRR